MTDLKTLIKDIAATKKHAAIDLEALPYQTRASLTNLKMDSIEKLEKLENEFTKHVRSSSAGVFLFGDAERKASFSSIAADEAGMLIVNAALMYERLALKVDPSIGAKREFGPTQLEGLYQGLRDVAKDLNVQDLRMPLLQNLTVVKEFKDTVNYIRKIIQKAVGDDLLRVYVDRKVNEAALASMFEGSTLPVLVTGLEYEEVPSLASLFTNSVTVEVGTTEDGEVNREFVLKQLNSLKKKFKNK